MDEIRRLKEAAAAVRALDNAALIVRFQQERAHARETKEAERFGFVVGVLAANLGEISPGSERREILFNAMDDFEEDHPGIGEMLANALDGQIRLTTPPGEESRENVLRTWLLRSSSGGN